MTLDIRARATAQRMIAGFGKSVSLSKKSTGSYDPDTGSAVETVTVIAVYAIIEEWRGTWQQQMVVAGDKKVTVAAAELTEAPQPNWTVTIDGVVFTVIEINTVYSGELAAVYELRARK